MHDCIQLIKNKIKCYILLLLTCYQMIFNIITVVYIFNKYFLHIFNERLMLKVNTLYTIITKAFLS